MRSNKKGRTLMHYAAANGSVRCLEALLHFGADPCAYDFESRTPLHEACKYSSESGGDTFVKMECCVFDHDS